MVFSLIDEQCKWLANQGKNPKAIPSESIWWPVYGYDLRAGGVETSFKEAKQGLGVHKRNKKSFEAQEMLMLLSQLAQNLIVWARNSLALSMPKLKKFGMLRMVRDTFQIMGQLKFDSQGNLTEVTLNESNPLAKAFNSGLARDGTVVILRQI